MNNSDRTLIEAYIFMRIVKVYCIVSVFLVIGIVTRSMLELVGDLSHITPAELFAIFIVIALIAIGLSGIAAFVWSQSMQIKRAIG